MDKYIRRIITELGHHLKPIQGGTIRKQGIKWSPNIEDMIAVICIAFDFRHPFTAIELIFLTIFVSKILA